MNLNVRPVNGDRSGRLYSIDPPEIRVDGEVKYDFYLALVAVSEALHAWTDEPVLRGRKSDCWHVSTESGRYRLTISRQGRRMFVLCVEFQGSVRTFLESVEDRIDIDSELKGYAQDIDRQTTNRLVVDQSVVDQWVKERGYAPGRHLQVGLESRHTPPPSPMKPTRVPSDIF
jgi:hypothetical protein